jgi:2-haloacid dehalogenase
MSQVMVFDVNETLLNTAALDPFFERLFDDTRTRTEWFLTLEECWMAATIVNQFKPFGELAQAALVMVGRRQGIDVSADAQHELVDALQAMPPHEDVAQSLDLLKNRGFKLVALSNSSSQALQKQLDSASLAEKFDVIISVDEVQRFKPAPEPYQRVAERLGIETSQMTMVAAHAWDIAGAAGAGCRTAFVERPGKVMNPAGPQPDFYGSSLKNVAEQLASP